MTGQTTANWLKVTAMVLTLIIVIVPAVFAYASMAERVNQLEKNQAAFMRGQERIDDKLDFLLKEVSEIKGRLPRP